MVPLIEELPDVGNEKPGLARLALHGMGGERKIKNRNALNAEGAAIDGGIPAHLHDDLVRVELPLGARQFAGGDGSVVNQVVIGPGLLHHLAGKGKGIWGSQDQPLASKPHASGANHVFEASGFRADVVGSLSGFDVLVVRAAVEHHVAVRNGISGVGVVVHRIGIQNVGAVVNLRLAAQLEYGAVFFLLQGADGDILLSRRGRRGGQDDDEAEMTPLLRRRESNWLVTMDGASSR